MRKLPLLAAAMLALGGCSAGRDKAAAESGVVRFHQLLDAGRYHDIYAGAASEFRRSGTEQDAIAFLATVHDRLGAVREPSQQGWRVNLGTGGNIVNLRYDTRFASGRGAEDFVFRVNGGSASLVGYHINSTGLAAPPAASAKPGTGK